MIKQILIGVAVTLGAYFPWASRAQDNQLEEIVVTAQKRVENLQSVPVSAQVIGSQTLQQQDFNNLSDLTEVVPSVHIATSSFSNELFIRGIGSGDNPSFDQSVATFVDDIYRGRSRLTGDTFLDLDRIEVLKGPQSTFFGNNAIAGALNIVTKKPGDTFDAWGRLLYGQFGQYAAEGAVGLPLSDTLGVRIAVSRNGGSGWIENINSGEKEPDVNNEAARITVLYRPSADLDVTFKIAGSDNRTLGSGTQWDACPPPAPYTPSFIFAGACVNALALHVPLGLNNNLTPGLPGQYSSLSTFEDVLTVNYRVLGQTLTSVTGFNNYHYDANGDNSVLPTNPVGTNVFPESYNQSSQEFRLASPTDQPIEYLVGGYFQMDHLDWQQVFNATLLNPYAPPALAPYLPFASSGAFTQEEHVYSLFGSVSWNATDRLKFNAGLRESWVNKDFTTIKSYGTGTSLYGGFVPLPASLAAFPAIFFGAPGAASLSQSNSAPMPSAGVQYQLSPETMAYFSYNRGFKAGGFNGDTTFGPVQNLEYGPEHVNAYEIGLKSKWFNNTLLVNVDAFRSDYDGLQVSAAIHNVATGTWNYFINNAAASRSQGIELESQWLATASLRFSTNVTYLNAYYVRYEGPATNLQTFCAASYVLPYCTRFPSGITANEPYNYAGHPLNYSPRLSGRVAATYRWQLPRGLDFVSEVSPFFSSRYNPDPDAILSSSGGYVRLDARLSLETADGHWALDVIGKNLTDRIIVDTGADALSGIEGPTVKEEPRNVAAQVRFKW
jgi:iron complex outermembrane recepter protein